MSSISKHALGGFLGFAGVAGIYKVIAMSEENRNPKPKGNQAMMLGIGLDSDGHKRVTTGDNFALVGGTKETHEEMTEKAIKINEKLASKGKRLEEVSREEFDDIAHSVGLRRHAPDREKGE